MANGVFCGTTSYAPLPNCPRGQYVACWLFILAVEAFDCWYAWRYRSTFAAWELNPVAVWSVSVLGMWAFFALKMAVALSAFALSLYDDVRFLVTSSLFIVHALLAAWYLVLLLA